MAKPEHITISIKNYNFNPENELIIFQTENSSMSQGRSHIESNFSGNLADSCKTQLILASISKISMGAFSYSPFTIRNPVEGHFLPFPRVDQVLGPTEQDELLAPAAVDFLGDLDAYEERFPGFDDQFGFEGFPDQMIRIKKKQKSLGNVSLVPKQKKITVDPNVKRT